VNANVQFLRRPPDFKYARLEGWLVDVPANSLTRGDADVRLTPKAMSVLRELIGRQGNVVRRDDLLGLVWRDGFPTDDVLTHAITELRRALDDDPRSPRIIETIPKVGYRLLSRAELLEALPGDERSAVAAPAVTAPLEPQRRPWPLWVALVLLLLMAIVVPGWRATGPRVVDASRPLAPDTAWLSGAGLREFAVTADPTREQFPSLSPDGGTVAYVAVRADGSRSHIALKSLDSAGVAVQLTDPPAETSDQMPTWSPDGKQIAFLRMNDSGCMVHLMPALGGASRAVAPCPSRIYDYIDWSTDGRSLLLSRRPASDDGSPMLKPGTITRLELDSGKLVPLVYAPQALGEDDLQPKASPDGRWIAFRRGAAPYSDLFVMPAHGGDARRLTYLRARIRGYGWYPDSRNLLLSSDHAGRQTLYRLDMISGDMVSLGLHDAHFPSLAAKAPVAVYQLASELMQMAEVRLDSGADTIAPTPLAPSTRSDWFPALSPSGSRLAFVSMRTNSAQLWIHEFEGQRTYPVTRVAEKDLGFPQWAPDGSAVLVIARGGGSSRLLRVHVDSAHGEWLTPDAERVRWASYTRDGAWILFSSDRSGTWQVWRMRPDGTEAEQLSRTGGFDPRDFLGDGAVYYTKETDPGLFRLDLGTREEQRVSWHAGYWNMDAMHLYEDGLYFLDAPGEGGTLALVRVPLQLEGVGQRGDAGDPLPERVLGIEGLPVVGQMSISADKTRLITVVMIRDETDLMAVNLAAPVTPR
jgi:Tol biopolymer transport system component/DNA-binding winged helix-turn-helix (wHTH) protein